MRTIFWTLAFLILLPSLPVGAQAPSVDSQGSLSASLNRESAPVGTVVLLNLDYCLPRGGRLPEKIDIQGLENASIVDQKFDPGRISIRVILESTQTLGTGPIRLKYIDELGDEHWLETGGIRIDVISNLEQKLDERGLKPIRDIIPTQSYWRPWLFWGIPAVLIVVAILGMIIWYKRRTDASRWRPQQIAPHVRAKRSIDDLLRSGSFEQGKYKAFYFRFSEILKHYLEEIRGFPAAEFTTEEISSSISHKEDYSIVGLLKQADLVKFADAIPTSARRDGEVATALSYIDETSSMLQPDPGNVLDEEQKA
ncbi:MAG: hypothetical protein JW920_10970 [Deltaproteobacteria bacterium]|nr:hypothetical protein [Deltaproteobacteria bacterium]